MAVAVPNAERSGSHRVVDVEVGDVRQIVATVAGMATLARAPTIGPRALAEAVPELRAQCLAAPAIVAGALLPACDVVALSTGLTEDARAALEALVSATRVACAKVLAALDAVERRSGGARARLALQRACELAADSLAAIRDAIEILQRASIGEPVAVGVDDLLHELADVPPARAGRVVHLALLGDLDLTVAVHPRVAVSVLRGLLARAVAEGGGDAATFIASGGHTRASLTLHAGAEAPTLDVALPPPNDFDPLVLRLAAATLAAEVGPRSVALLRG